MTAPGALAGIRILDLSRILAAPSQPSCSAIWVPTSSRWNALSRRRRPRLRPPFLGDPTTAIPGSAGAPTATSDPSPSTIRHLKGPG